MNKPTETLTKLIPRSRRRSIAVAMTLVLLVAAIRLQDRAMPISYYRLVGEQTIVIGTISGPGAWTRVTALMETTSSVTIGVSALRAPLPGTGENALELIVTLRDPLDSRTVIDASSGLAVPRTRCLPPAADLALCH